MLKVAVGGFHHETNTFNPKPTLLKQIEETKRRDAEGQRGSETRPVSAPLRLCVYRLLTTR